MCVRRIILESVKRTTNSKSLSIARNLSRGIGIEVLHIPKLLANELFPIQRIDCHRSSSAIHCPRQNSDICSCPFPLIVWSKIFHSATHLHSRIPYSGLMTDEFGEDTSLYSYWTKEKKRTHAHGRDTQHAKCGTKKKAFRINIHIQNSNIVNTDHWWVNARYIQWHAFYTNTEKVFTCETGR